MFELARMPFLMSAAFVDAMLSESGKEKVTHHPRHTRMHKASKHGHTKHAAPHAKAA
jgi:hypothetical protein